MPLNPGDRQREIAIQLRMQLVFERAVFKRMRAVLNAAAQAAAKGFKNGGQIGVEIALERHLDDVQRTLRAGYLRTGQAFGKRVMEAVREAETRDDESIFDAAFVNWVRDRAAVRAKQISDTTIVHIRAAILDAEMEGEGLSGVVKRIRGTTKLNRFRARVIARTEVHTAANAASLEAANATRVRNLKREWLAVEDERTRSSHMDADGDIVAIDEPFQVGEAKLMFPGDPSGPAKEVINCRCATAFITPDLG